MKKTLNLFAAASLAAAGFAFMGYDRAVLADDQGAARISAQANDRGTTNTILPQGVTRSDRADEAGIRHALAGVVRSVMSSDGKLTTLDDYLARNDANRLNKLDQNQNQTALRDSIDRLRRDFKAKYNQDFNMDGEMAFGNQFKDFVIVQGEVSNPALMSNWPVEATGSANAQTSTQTRTDTTIHNDTNAHGNTTTDEGKRQDVGGPGRPPLDPNVREHGNNTGASVNTHETTTNTHETTTTHLDRGMNVAIATFPASHGAPEINVSLVRQTSATINGAHGEANTGANTQVKTDITTNGNATQDGKRNDVGGPGRPAVNDNGAGNTQTRTRTETTTGNTGTTALHGDTSGGAAMSDWKVDLPNTVTADRLEKNLSMHLNEVDQMKDQWPADATEGYRMVSHHIFMALYDVNEGHGAGVNAHGDINVGH
jgi:hypothetical protein